MPAEVFAQALKNRRCCGLAKPASTAPKYCSPGVALGSESGAVTDRRPSLPQPRAAKRTTASWLPTSRAAARSRSRGGFSPASGLGSFSTALRSRPGFAAFTITLFAITSVRAHS